VKNGRKTFCITSSEIPGPRSSTEIRQPPSVAVSMATSTSPFEPPASWAFLTRLMSTCWICATRKVDVRIVSATNVDLARAIADGTFREDLFFRLNVIELQIPPIADRPDDILPLAEYFLATLAGQDGVTGAGLSTLGEPARDALLQYEWPGNVRELQNRIHRAMLVSAGGTITPEHLGLSGDVTARSPGPRLETLGVPRSATVPEPSARLPSSGSDAADPDRAMVEDALRRAGGVVSKAAAEMGVSRQALYRRMERAGIVLERRLKI
jgi:DNA-binding NtrC family response regulator